MGCGGAHNSEQSGSAATGSKGPSESFSGLVGIGNGRKLYMECRGTGSPTVVLVSGTQGAFDEWTHAFDSSYRGAEPKAVGWAVFPRVAAMTRVCAYDHPGTTRLGGGLTPSTSVAQPTTARDGVADLHALLTAAGEPGPYVLVGASWGGVIVKLYASTYPEEVVGLVFVDGASDLLKETFTPAQWAGWMQKIEASASNSPKGLEAPNYEPSVQEILAAPPVPRVPAVVLTPEVPWDLKVGGGSTWPGLAPSSRSSRDRVWRQAHHKHAQRPSHRPGATPARHRCDSCRRR